MAARRGLRRSLVGVSDQLVYSLTNFALTVMVARSVSASQFGSYALIAATYLLGVAIIRGLTSEALVIRYSARDRSAWRGGASAAGGAAVTVAVLLGLLLVLAGLGDRLFIHGDLAGTLIVFGCLFPGLVLQDFSRFAALALGRPALALGNDLVMAAVQFGLIGALLVWDSTSVAHLVAAWGIAAHVGAVIGLRMMRLRVEPRRTAGWFRSDGDLGVRYAIDDLAAQSSQQGTAYVVAAVGGLTQTGALRGAQTVFGPPSIVNVGVQAAVTPELVRVLIRSSTKMRRYAMFVGLALGAFGLAWGLAALLVPNWVGHALFGDTWKHARPLLGYFVIAQVATGLRVTPIIGLRALGAANRTLRARVAAIALAFVLLMAGAVWDGARGAAIATAILTPLQWGIWWVEYRLALRDHLRERALRHRDERWQQLLATVDQSDQDTAFDAADGMPWIVDTVGDGALRTDPTLRSAPTRRASDRRDRHRGRRHGRRRGR